MFSGVDIHTVVDFAVIAFSAFQAYENTKIKIEIMALKLWIIQNFHSKPTAEFDGAEGLDMSTGGASL